MLANVAASAASQRFGAPEDAPARPGCGLFREVRGGASAPPLHPSHAQNGDCPRRLSSDEVAQHARRLLGDAAGGVLTWLFGRTVAGHRVTGRGARARGLTCHRAGSAAAAAVQVEVQVAPARSLEHLIGVPLLQGSPALAAWQPCAPRLAALLAFPGSPALASRQPCAAAALPPGSPARQPCAAALRGSPARQPCAAPAALRGSPGCGLFREVRGGASAPPLHPSHAQNGDCPRRLSSDEVAQHARRLLGDAAGGVLTWLFGRTVAGHRVTGRGARARGLTCHRAGSAAAAAVQVEVQVAPARSLEHLIGVPLLRRELRVDARECGRVSGEPALRRARGRASSLRKVVRP